MKLNLQHIVLYIFSLSSFCTTLSAFSSPVNQPATNQLRNRAVGRPVIADIDSKIEMKQDLWPNKNWYSFSAKGADISGFPVRTLVRLCYNKMKKLHEDNLEGRNKLPGMMSALIAPDGFWYCHSSMKGALKKGDPDAIHIQVQGIPKTILASLSKDLGPHANRGCCAEIRNSESYFQNHPNAKEIPKISKWKAYNPNSSKKESCTEAENSKKCRYKAPCEKKGNSVWGCKHYMHLVKTLHSKRLHETERMIARIQNPK